MSLPRSSGKTSEARELRALSGLIRTIRPENGTRPEYVRAAAELVTLACFGIATEELLELARDVREAPNALPAQCAFVAGKVASDMAVSPLPPGLLSHQCAGGVRWASREDRMRATKIAMRVVVRKWVEICSLAGDLARGADRKGPSVTSVLEGARSSVGVEPGELPWASEIEPRARVFPKLESI